MGYAAINQTDSGIHIRKHSRTLLKSMIVPFSNHQLNAIGFAHQVNALEHSSSSIRQQISALSMYPPIFVWADKVRYRAALNM